jgi:hypothetical protein
VDDYSEFPTTPTGWQERQAQEWQTVTPLSTEDVAVPARRRVDRAALIPGLIFVFLAVALMAGVNLPFGLWRGGGFVWVILVGAGIALLASELRRTRGRR